MEIMNYSLCHINAKIQLVGSDFQWKFIGFYGHPYHAFRSESWQLLAHISQDSPRDWMCTGDFNEIVCLSEKFGGAFRSENQMDSFRSTLVDYGRRDLGYRGPKFTWSNKRDSVDFIKERLDRALATGSWCARFSEVYVEVLVARSSDHRPLWIRFKPVVLTCGTVINETWCSGGSVDTPMARATHRLEACKQALRTWSKEKFGAGACKIKIATRQLEWLQSQEHPGNVAIIKELQLKLHRLLEMEDLKWKQRKSEMQRESNSPNRRSWKELLSSISSSCILQKDPMELMTVCRW